MPSIPGRRPKGRRRSISETLRTVNNSVNLLATELGRLRQDFEHLQWLHTVSLDRWETFWREYVQEQKGLVPSLSSKRVGAPNSRTYGGGLPTEGAPPPTQQAEVEDWS